MPKELGGDGKGQNPEQLFSLGYSACFLGAMGLASRSLKLKLPEGVSVETQTSIGTPEGGEGFGIALKVVVRGEGSEISQGDLEKIVEAGHQVRLVSRWTWSDLSRGTDDDFPSRRPVRTRKPLEATSRSTSTSKPSSAQLSWPAVAPCLCIASKGLYIERCERFAPRST